MEDDPKSRHLAIVNLNKSEYLKDASQVMPCPVLTLASVSVYACCSFTRWKELYHSPVTSGIFVRTIQEENMRWSQPAFIPFGLNLHFLEERYISQGWKIRS